MLNPLRIWNDLWPITLGNLKTRNWRCVKLCIFGIIVTRQTIWHYFQGNWSMFQFLTHAKPPRSMAAILKMHSMLHIWKILLIVLLNSVQSLTVLKFCAQIMDVLSCLTIDNIYCTVPNCPGNILHRSSVAGRWLTLCAW